MARILLQDPKRIDDITFTSRSYMNSMLTPPISQRDIPEPSAGPKKKPSGSFTHVLTDVIGKSISQNNSTKTGASTILIGEITREVRTVSELLSQHKKLSGSTWDIIYSEQNQNKDYTKIKPGTPVYFNPEDGSLTWPGVDSAMLPPNRDSKIAHFHSASPHRPAAKQPEIVSNKELIKLGKIDSNTPTVSHLLKDHPGFKKQMWELLGSNINQGKPYHRIAAGTEIHLNTETMELVWSDNAAAATFAKPTPPAVDHSPVIKTPPAEQPNHSAIDLSEAVQGYKGISYDKINCYELLVKGLHNLDIAYSGKNGLFAKLTNMAIEKGLAPNAYLNGEGIVKAAGSTILSRNYSKILNWRDKAGTLMEEIEPLLGSGQILSFSTEKRGHTGIVARKDNQWTFINSGRMDNSVDQETIPRGVGEEVLNEEICNWFRTAQENGETLSVTLGQLDQGKFQTAFNMSQSFSERI